MQDLLQEYYGMDIAEIDLQEVESRLRQEELFSEIEVRISDDLSGSESGCVLQITVKEKITFLPIPFASYSNDGFMGGFMLMNMNAFGRKNMVVAGGVFSPTMQMGVLAFSKPAVEDVCNGFSAFLSVSHRDEEIVDFDDVAVLDFAGLSLQAALGMEVKFSKIAAGSLGMAYSCRNIWDSDLDSVHQWVGRCGVSFSESEWNGWYLVASSADLGVEAGISRSGGENELVSGISARTVCQFAPVSRLRFGVLAAVCIEENKREVLLPGGGSIGATILPSDFKSDSLLGAGLDVEFGLCRAKFATVSLFGSYEISGANDVDGTFRWCSGPGMGVKVYLSRIAFPALLVGASYNIDCDRWHFVASLGMAW